MENTNIINKMNQESRLEYFRNARDWTLLETYIGEVAHGKYRGSTHCYEGVEKIADNLYVGRRKQ